jgi:glycosyltransferase involved in cell wall biosynthesis
VLFGYCARVSVNNISNSNPTSFPPAEPGGAEGKTGVVIIGRNEGERLRRCLQSLGTLHPRSVYVDSGSTDDSVALAREFGVAVVNLDMAEPFTAARARNVGFWKLLQMHSGLDYVFFVDGDCEVVSGWVNLAVDFLGQNPKVAVVFGYRRERHPDASVYNRICDLEWQDIPLGEASTCGGDIVARVPAIKQVDGYRPDMICGEEPEMCVRLRQQGWQIWRINTNMTIHDAAMDRFGQWWKRSMRGGFGYAQGAYIHGASPQRHWVSEYRRTWIWGLFLPGAILCLSIAVSWKMLALFGLYPLQMIRLAVNGRHSAGENWRRAVFLMLGKFPEMLGQVQFLRDRFMRMQSRLIEYK